MRGGVGGRDRGGGRRDDEVGTNLMPQLKFRQNVTLRIKLVWPYMDFHIRATDYILHIYNIYFIY